MKARGFGGRGGQMPVPSTASVERTTLVTDDPFAKSSSKELDQRRLQNLKTTGGGGVVGQRPAKSKSTDIRELDEWHRVKLAELCVFRQLGSRG
jgi:hypothetical protein